MATPDVQQKILNLAVQASDGAQLILQVNDLSGTAIDVSSGYTAILQYQSQSAPVRGTTVVLGPTSTGTVGGQLTMHWTSTQSRTIPCGEAIPATISISNDSFVTSTVLANGFVRCQQALQ